MRASSWRIVWNPLGETPRVLLDFGDTMPNELGRRLAQSVDVMRADFSSSATPRSRRNKRQSLNFGRLLAHEYPEDAWQACHASLALAPWGVKGILEVSPPTGIRRFYVASLVSNRNEPSSAGPTPESLHEFDFRVAPLSALILPGGIVIIGGFFNGIEGGYTVPQLPPGVSIPTGTVVIVSGTPGFVSGNYTVSGPGIGSGGEGPIELEPEVLAPVEKLSDPSVSAGSPYPGGSLIATPAAWAHATEVIRQWYVNGAPTGISSTTWAIPAEAEPGTIIFWQEIASNELGSAGAQSNWITVLELPFMNLSPPLVSGGTEPGSTLTATPGEWQSEDSVTGEWYHNGSPTGFTGSTYDIPEDAEEGEEVFYRETATKEGEDDLTASSNIVVVAEFDDSPVTVPAAMIWPLSFYSSGPPGGPYSRIFRALRRVKFLVEWRSLPPGTKIHIEHFRWLANGEGETGQMVEVDLEGLSGDGSTDAETSFNFDIEISPESFTDEEDADIMSGLFDGLDYTASVATTHEDFEHEYTIEGVPQFKQVTVRRGEPSLLLVVRNEAGTILATYNIVPNFTTANQLRSSASQSTLQDSGRAMRLTWEEGEITLQTPAGFTVS